jgi:hypothetical protein
MPCLNKAFLSGCRLVKRLHLRCFNHLPWLLLVLPAYPVVGQSRSSAAGAIGIVPGTGAPTAATRPDVAVAPSKGVGVAGHPPAGTGLQAVYRAGAPRGALPTAAWSQAWA